MSASKSSWIEPLIDPFFARLAIAITGAFNECDSEQSDLLIRSRDSVVEKVAAVVSSSCT